MPGKRGRCGGLRGKRPEAARRKCGGGDDAERLDEAAALKTRDPIIGHARVRGCRVMTKSTCSTASELSPMQMAQPDGSITDTPLLL